MEIIFISLLIIFIAAAYQDYRKREVSDWLTATAWLLSAFVFNMQHFVFFFVIWWLVAELAEKAKMPLMGFGDVLWLPIGISMIYFIGGNGGLMSFVAMLVSQVYLWYRLSWKNELKEKVNGSPFVLVLLVMLVVAMLWQLLFQV